MYTESDFVNISKLHLNMCEKICANASKEATSDTVCLDDLLQGKLLDILCIITYLWATQHFTGSHSGNAVICTGTAISSTRECGNMSENVECGKRQARSSVLLLCILLPQVDGCLSYKIRRRKPVYL